MPRKITYRVTGGCCLCGDCLSACPVGAITMNSTGALINEYACLGCGRCVVGCRAGAIAIIVDETV